jgi:hypothetical protein
VNAGISMFQMRYVHLESPSSTQYAMSPGSGHIAYSNEQTQYAMSPGAGDIAYSDEHGIALTDAICDVPRCGALRIFGSTWNRPHIRARCPQQTCFPTKTTSSPYQAAHYMDYYLRQPVQCLQRETDKAYENFRDIDGKKAGRWKYAATFSASSISYDCVVNFYLACGSFLTFPMIKASDCKELHTYLTHGYKNEWLGHRMFGMKEQRENIQRHLSPKDSVNVYTTNVPYAFALFGWLRKKGSIIMGKQVMEGRGETEGPKADFKDETKPLEVSIVVSAVVRDGSKLVYSLLEMVLMASLGHVCFQPLRTALLARNEDLIDETMGECLDDDMPDYDPKKDLLEQMLLKDQDVIVKGWRLLESDPLQLEKILFGPVKHEDERGSGQGGGGRPGAGKKKKDEKVASVRKQLPLLQENSCFNPSKFEAAEMIPKKHIQNYKYLQKMADGRSAQTAIAKSWLDEASKAHLLAALKCQLARGDLVDDSLPPKLLEDLLANPVKVMGDLAATRGSVLVSEFLFPQIDRVSRAVKSEMDSNPDEQDDSTLVSYLGGVSMETFKEDYFDKTPVDRPPSPPPSDSENEEDGVETAEETRKGNGDEEDEDSGELRACTDWGDGIFSVGQRLAQKHICDVPRCGRHRIFVCVQSH